MQARRPSLKSGALACQVGHLADNGTRPWSLHETNSKKQRRTYPKALSLFQDLSTTSHTATRHSYGPYVTNS